MNIVSVAYYAESEEIKRAVLLSDYVRAETLRRLCALPSYGCKPLKWKNLYYDYFKKQVLREVEERREVLE